jgi:hypothetical protein
VASSGITFIPNFVKIGQLVQNLETVHPQVHRPTHSMAISLACCFLLKKIKRADKTLVSVFVLLAHLVSAHFATCVICRVLWTQGCQAGSTGLRKQTSSPETPTMTLAFASNSNLFLVTEGFGIFLRPSRGKRVVAWNKIWQPPYLLTIINHFSTQPMQLKQRHSGSAGQ